MSGLNDGNEVKVVIVLKHGIVHAVYTEEHNISVSIREYEPTEETDVREADTRGEHGRFLNTSLYSQYLGTARAFDTLPDLERRCHCGERIGRKCNLCRGTGWTEHNEWED
jgi:hypothetical protein